MTPTAIILAGGLGTRLKPTVTDLPKPMAPVNGKPFLSFLLRYLNHYGIKQVLLSVSHLREKIMNHFGNHAEGLAINYIIEETPQGTGGGLRLALEHCTDEKVIVLNGDSFFDIDLERFSEMHDASGSVFSLALRKVDDTSRYGAISASDDGRILSFAEKQNHGGAGSINGGVYLVNRQAFLSETHAGIFSLEKDYLEKKAGTLPVYGFTFEGYFIDIGIPEDYRRAQHELAGFKY